MKVMRDLVGETLSDRYHLTARVAGGGMGDVYRGHDLLLDRTVAVKILQPALAADPELVARFRSEARAAARLTHPHVVSVHDWGAEDDRTYYMVMEFVAGTDLRDVLVGHGSLDPAQSIAIVIALCDALDAAHARGLVHRDVKPENILISASGVVKVTDFGIAAVAGADVTAPGGVISGTLRYLAPEQARGESAGPAADIWAAGAVLSELLTGRPPSQGWGADLLRHRAEDPPTPPSAAASGVPPELDEVVLKACAVDPAGRWRSAAEMGDALRAVATRRGWLPVALDDLVHESTGEVRLPELDPTNFSPPSRRRPRRTWRSRAMRASMLAAVLLLLVVGGATALPALLGPNRVAVPRLVGLTKGQAVARAAEAGLRVEVAGTYPDFDVPVRQVLAQTPAGGRLLEGRTIEIVVSSGPPWMRVPALRGMDLAQAQIRLRARGMTTGVVTRRHSLEPAGAILRQQPSEGRLRWGSEVGLVVSRGPRPVEVPDVAEMRSTRAAAALEAAGFEPVLVDAYSDEIAPGRVVSTDPVAGELAPMGSDVQVLVSMGPEFEELTLPDVTGQDVGAARSQLEDLGLRVRVVVSCAGGSTVVDTDPIPGTRVHENDVVALFVC